MKSMLALLILITIVLCDSLWDAEFFSALDYHTTLRSSKSYHISGMVPHFPESFRIIEYEEHPDSLNTSVEVLQVSISVKNRCITEFLREEIPYRTTISQSLNLNGKRKYEYDSLLNITKIEFFDYVNNMWEKDYIQSFTWNEKELLGVLEYMCFPKTKLKESKEYSYSIDSDKKKVKKIIERLYGYHNNEGTVVKSNTNYYYNEFGQYDSLIGFAPHHADSLELNKREYHIYDQNQNRVFTKAFNKYCCQKIYSETVFQYNNFGKMTSAICKSVSGKNDIKIEKCMNTGCPAESTVITYDTTTFIYNQDFPDQIVYEKQMYNGQLYFEKNYEYTSKGNLKEVSLRDNNGVITSTIYTYDEDGFPSEILQKSSGQKSRDYLLKTKFYWKD